VALSIDRARRVYRNKTPKNKSLVPRDYRHICGGVLGSKNGEIRAVVTLCFKQTFWGIRGYTAVERRYSVLHVRREDEKSKGHLTALKRMFTIPGELSMVRLKLNLILESGKKMEKDWNKRIRSSQEEMKRVLWFYHVHQSNYIRKNYKETYELWREKNPMTRKI
jgi:hypothetical protein